MVRVLLPALLAVSFALQPVAGQDDLPPQPELDQGPPPLAEYGDIVLADEEASLDLAADLETVWQLAMDQLGDRSALLPAHVLSDTWLVIDDLWLRLESLPYKTGTWTRARVRVDGFDQIGDVVAAEGFLIELAGRFQDLRDEQRAEYDARRAAEAPPLRPRDDSAGDQLQALWAMPSVSVWVPFHVLLALALDGWSQLGPSSWLLPLWQSDPYAEVDEYEDDWGYDDYGGGGGWNPGGDVADSGGDGGPGDLPGDSGGGGDGGDDDVVDRPPLNPPLAFGGEPDLRFSSRPTKAIGSGKAAGVGRRSASGPKTVGVGHTKTTPQLGGSLGSKVVPKGAWVPRVSGSGGASGSTGSTGASGSTGSSGATGSGWTIGPTAGRRKGVKPSSAAAVVTGSISRPSPKSAGGFSSFGRSSSSRASVPRISVPRTSISRTTTPSRSTPKPRSSLLSGRSSGSASSGKARLGGLVKVGRSSRSSGSSRAKPAKSASRGRSSGRASTGRSSGARKVGARAGSGRP